MTISDELDLLSLDVGANLADRSVTLLLRRRGFNDATMKDEVLGSVSMSVAAQVSAVRGVEGDLPGPGAGGVTGGAGSGMEMCEAIVTHAAIAAATKTNGGTLDARLTALNVDGGDVMTIGGVEWSVVSAKLQVGGRLWRVVLTRKKSG